MAARRNPRARTRQTPQTDQARRALEVLRNATERANGMLGRRSRTVGGPVDILTAASQAMHAAKKASDAADAAISAPGKAAARVLADGVLEAERISKDVFTAMGQGAQDLIDDAYRVVLQPVLVLGLLYLLLKAM